MQPASVRSHERPRERGSDHSEVLAKHLDRLLLARYSPPGVLVNENLEVLLFRGATGRYLQAAPGRPQTNLRGMLRGGLLSVLPAAIAEAKQERVVIQRPDIEVDRDGVKGSCDLTIIPFMGLPNASEPLFVVLFDSSRHDLGRAAAPAPASVPAPATSGAPPAATDGLRYVRLEQELAATQQYLHTVIEEHSRANDELGASNEELVSGNEELQSTNEELETAKEELQSINEELTTLNDELQRRNQETTQINSDLLNFSLAVDVAILRLDLDRCIRRFTPQARSILNVLPSDVGRSIHDIRLNIDVPDLEQQISDVLETTGRKESEVQDRTGRWFRMQIRPYTTVERSIEGVVISLVDVDNLKHLVAEAETARGQAESANRAKDDFLATLSHELRTPLSSMLLNAQRLRSGDVLAPADMRRMGEVLERSAKFQVKLVDDLLDVSRIIAGKLSLDLGPVDLCSVVRAALESVSAPAEAKSLVLRASLDPGLAMITADRVRVQQVVTNLLTNAIKFTPAHGTLTIEVDSTPAFARLRVTDSGIGIEPEFLPHVFSRFTQSDSSITRTNGGLGLGLAIVRHLVELHGGTASAQSDGRGRGATFVVTFPFTNASVAPFASRNVLNRPGRQRNYDGLVNLRVLFVDDDAQTRDAVLEVLRLTGANVEVAVSAADGMRMVDAFNPHVILCDIAMPGEDGYTFIRKLRARTVAEGSHTPALALTALAAEDDRRRALDAGFQRHLAKPIDIDRLRDAVLELSTCAIVDA
jgi:two-component system CheB/CheR fusion protein